MVPGCLRREPFPLVAENTARSFEQCEEQSFLDSARLSTFRFRRLHLSLLIVSVLATLLFAVSYKLAHTKFYRTFNSHVSVPWSNLGPCSATDSDSVGFAKLKRIATWFPGKPAAVATCSSDWFVPAANYLELEYAASKPIGSPHKLYIAIERESDGSKVRLQPAEGKRYGTWRLMGHFLEDLEPTERLRLHLVDHEPGAGWLSLRERINFYDVPQWTVLLRRFAAERASIIHWAFCASLVVTACLALPLAQGFFSACMVSAGLSLLVHYRFDLFFYGDDLLFFERFIQHGIKGIFISHHEHFIPLFSALFQAEYRLFGGNYFAYQLVTFGLFAANAALLFVLLRKLGLKSTAAAVLSCGLFSCCALQTAVVQWITCQSTLLSISFRLLAYLSALAYLRGGRVWLLFSLFACTIAAPLCFGGGVTLWAEVLLLALLFAPKYRQQFWKVAGATLAAAGIVAVAYLLNRQGIGQGRDEIAMPHLEPLLRYTFFGSQFGSFLRGLGFYQLQFYVPNTQLMFKDLALTLISSGVSLALLGYYLFKRNGGWRHWLLGQLVLISPFLLTAIGRYDWGGVEYSLSLRYHAVSLLGVCLLLAPLFLPAGRPTELPMRGKKKKLLFATVALTPLLALFWMDKQLELANYSRFYSDRGQLDRSFAQQVAKWNAMREQLPSPTSYEALGTSDEGMYPIPYGSSPDDPVAYNWQRHPDALHRLLHP